MKKSFLFMFIAVALGGASASLMAQEPRGATATAGTFVMSEFAEKPVKGAPYSAQAITESRQRLADGNEIVNKSEATVYRDTQGRTRREQTLKMIGGLSEAAPLQLITISDPVAGATYTLDPSTKTARKGYFNSFFLSSNGGGAPSLSVSGGGATAITLNRTEASSGGAGAGGNFSTASGGRVATTINDRVGLLKQTLENVKREDLGTQVIEGVEATIG